MNEPASLDRVRAVKSHAYDVFSALADVVGIGITTIGSGYGLKVNLGRPPEHPTELPTEVDGVPVRVEIVGPLRKRDST